MSELSKQSKEVFEKFWREVGGLRGNIFLRWKKMSVKEIASFSFRAGYSRGVKSAQQSVHLTGLRLRENQSVLRPRPASDANR
jgi:hypothetical protein